MAIYVIGDVQGCLDALQRLLARCRFAPGADRLIFAGDLVARGPDSLATLRFVRDLGAAATTVLGNHDLHLLGAAAGHGTARDGLEHVLRADDADELLHFVAQQRLAWHDPASDLLVIHAGLAPQWTVATALALAAEAEAMLRNADARAEFLPQMYGNEPSRWDDGLRGAARLRFIINCLTRARYCSADGQFDFLHKGAPGSQPPQLLPWFAAPGRASQDTAIAFGHWSTLGQVAWPQWRVFGLDTACVWNGALTALRVEDRALFRVDCAQSRA